MPQLEPGDIAPDFTLPTADGGQITLSELRGRKVVIFFFPAAMTPGCTREACDFEDFQGNVGGDYQVIGISPDPPERLAAFAAAERLTYPLASDVDRGVLEAYGAFGEKSLYGKTVTAVIRSTMVIDADGKVEVALYNVRAAGHVDRLRRELGVA